MEDQPSNNTTTGHSLGGASSNLTPLSPSELRRRRLAVLEGQQQQPTAALGQVQQQQQERQSNIETNHAAAASHQTQYQPQQQFHLQQQQQHRPITTMNNETTRGPPPRIVIPRDKMDMALAMDHIDIPNDYDDEDDEDSDLQAALAMSLGQQHHQQQQHHFPMETITPTPQQELQQPLLSSPPPLPPPPPPPPHYVQDLASVAEWWQTSEAANVGSFHDIMWDSQVTTENDKQRWVGQGIDVRDHNNNVMDHETLTATTATASTKGSSTTNSSATTATTNSNSNITGMESSLLAILGSDHRPWGLQQAHGGPCGVLAAIQAEMLRILLFASRRMAGHDHFLDFPTSPTQIQNETDTITTTTTTTTAFMHTATDVATTSTTILSHDVIRRALAMAISIILARAAYTPRAAGDDNSNDHPQQHQEQERPSPSQLENKKPALLVLPIHPSEAGLGWNDFEPWDIANKENLTAAANHSASLRVYTIAPIEDLCSFSSPKRQKTNDGSFPQDAANPTRSILDEKIIRLAHAVTTFLLHPSTDHVGGSSGGGGVARGECPIDSFQRPGGVILMVMSLVFSRGQDIVSQDMDYPTMLTSKFGHCGQELINLLLTGQAVSNVFDNALTPSGELTCRGIQARPAVGYLSQLESLRYCEVGGYYKSPIFPVWVVGSTSHFTVLFGDASCLKESKSDILLEKCRRAFKSVEGGDENGFIATTSLEKVLQLLNLDVGGDHAAQTLAAALEVSGAGIILWDEFWKATSRLLTGASLGSVLDAIGDGDKTTVGNAPPTTILTQAATVLAQQQQEEEDRKLTIAERDAALARQEQADQWGSHDGHSVTHTYIPPARPTSPMEVDQTISDEEFARRMQAQWDAEVSGTTSTAASAGGSPASSLQMKDITPLFADNDDVNTQHAVAADDVTTLTIFDDSKLPLHSRTPLDRVMEEPATSGPTKHDFERFGESFPLYHYNGLRGGTLTPFRVTRLTPEEAVGASIALNRGNTNSALHGAGGSGGDLEDIVRTKWPSCVINWLGKTPPYVD